MSMTPADKAFVWQHAAKWVHGPWRTNASAADELFADERAVSYAHWYYRSYVLDASDMNDLPAHPAAWDRYLTETAPFKCTDCLESYSDVDAFAAHLREHATSAGNSEDVELCNCTNEQLEAGQTCGLPHCPNASAAEASATNFALLRCCGHDYPDAESFDAHIHIVHPELEGMV